LTQVEGYGEEYASPEPSRRILEYQVVQLSHFPGVAKWLLVPPARELIWHLTQIVFSLNEELISSEVGPREDYVMKLFINPILQAFSKGQIQIASTARSNFTTTECDKFDSKPFGDLCGQPCGTKAWCRPHEMPLVGLVEK
jgi:hypothetical protein